MMKNYTFSQEEINSVKEAVTSLEKESCGEIVPFYVGKSDDYSEVSWYLASILGIAGLSIIALLSYTWNLPSISFIETFFIILLLMIIGYLVPIIFPVMKRIFVPQERRLEMVSLRANEAFLNEQVFNTEERVGILIFVSHLEHIVTVLGDEGINKKLETEDWEYVIDLITQGIKEKKVGEGIVNGINQCKELLLKNGFVRKDTDTNELSDDLRIQ